eukprot:3991156-Alexandrium_andersonii.AAC.1
MPARERAVFAETTPERTNAAVTSSTSLAFFSGMATRTVPRRSSSCTPIRAPVAPEAALCHAS